MIEKGISLFKISSFLFSVRVREELLCFHLFVSEISYAKLDVSRPSRPDGTLLKSELEIPDE